MKVLNLYAGIGGNRKLWTDCEVTAVELNEEVARVYQDFFPDDKVIVGDAHQYLLDHFKEFDFIWTSRPCTTHSRARFWGHSKSDPVYPDFGLYEEVVFLKYHFEGSWVTENVKPYYDFLYLLPPDKEIGRHVFWSNFKIQSFNGIDADIKNGTRGEWQGLHGLSIDGYKFSTRTDQILRNCVHPETGLHIFNCAKEIYHKSNTEQGVLEL